MSEYTCGLDLGQVHDATALVIVRRDPMASPSKAHVLVVHLARWMGLSYLDIVSCVRDELARVPSSTGRPRLVVDGTGVGRGIVDQLKRAGLAASVLPVSITAGEQHGPFVPDAFGYWPVPKICLVRGIYDLIEQRRISVPPDVAGAQDLRAELSNFQATFTRAGHLAFNAGDTAGGLLRDGAHDDYVSALSLALWGSVGLPEVRIRVLG
jgi:hypothetical protein